MHTSRPRLERCGTAATTTVIMTITFFVSERSASMANPSNIFLNTHSNTHKFTHTHTHTYIHAHNAYKCVHKICLYLREQFENGSYLSTSRNRTRRPVGTRFHKNLRTLLSFLQTRCSKRVCGLKIHFTLSRYLVWNLNIMAMYFCFIPSVFLV